MEAIAILDIFSQEDDYLFSLKLPTKSPLHPQQTIYTPSSVGGVTRLDSKRRKDLDDIINAAVEQLQRWYSDSKQSAKRSTAGVSLEELGQFLFSYLLPPPLRLALRELPEKMPIMLTTNDVGLPWELLHDGRDYLALKHPIGRFLWSREQTRRNSTKSNRLFLFIANPLGDLEQADHEVEELIELFDFKIKGADPKFLARSRASKRNLLEALTQQIDIIHYSGHAKPGLLRLADGNFTAEDIQKTVQGRPFVFLNGCWSVKEQPEISNMLSYAGLTSRSLAKAFIMGGAVGFIGTLWPVFDHSSRKFAKSFYTQVLNGVPVGEALRRTRVQMYDAKPDDPIWASFVFYGDPQFNLVGPMPRETRHVTVLVARLGGLGSLFSKLSLEDAVEIQELVIAALRDILPRYNGQFDVPFADTLSVRFGIPASHRDDAVHAIYAAREMLEKLQAFNRQWAKQLPEPLTLRIGISTGRVLHRWLPAGQTSVPNQIAGQVDGVAADLAALADFGQVLVDEDTYRSTESRFTFEAQGPSFITAKSMLFYRMLGIRRVVPPTTTIVGREDELDELARLWSQTKRGRGRVVGIVGEAGIGKTRLLLAFRNEMTDDHLWISATCHSYQKSQSYNLLAQIIRELASIAPHDQELTQRAKLKQFVGTTGSDQVAEGEINERLALLGSVLGLSFPTGRIENLKPAQRQRELGRAVEAVLKSQAAQQPVVLVLENLQSADEASLRVLEQVRLTVGRMRMLLLVTYWPDWEEQEKWHNWMRRPIRLHNLEEEAQRTLVGHLLGTAKPPKKLVQVILKQTAGHPLFIKEYIRLLKENGSLSRVGHVWTLESLSQIPLLNKVERVIQARLDRLSPFSRQVLQTAAVIGEEFEEVVLKDVLRDVAREQLEQALDTLTERRLIEGLGGSPYVYTFSHGLVRQIVYQLLSEGFQRAVHGRVARALKKVYEHEEQILYRLAHHYYHSHHRINTIRYCLRAAKGHAEERANPAALELEAAKDDAKEWANQAGLDWYQRAQNALASFDEKEPSEVEQMDGVTETQLLVWRAEALKGRGEIEELSGEWDLAVQSYLQAESLSTDLSSSPHEQADLMRRIGRQYGWGGEFKQALEWMDKGRKLLDPERDEAERETLALLDFHTASILQSKGEHEDAEELCKQELDLLGQEGDLATRAEGFNLLGAAQDMQGKYEEALRAYQTSIELWQILENQYEVKRVENNVAVIHSLRDDWVKAREVYHGVLDFFEQVQDRNRLAVICTNLGLFEYLLGDYDASARRQRRAIELSDELKIPRVQAPARVNLAWVHIARGEWKQAESLASESIEIENKHQLNHSLSEAYRVLAEVALGRGQLDLARNQAQKALALAPNRLEEAAALRVLGHVLRLAHDFQAAAPHLQSSLEILNDLGNRFEAARTERQLACLKRDVGKNNHALGHAIRALTVFIEMEAQGEARAMQAANELTFHYFLPQHKLQQPLTEAALPAEVAAFCRAEMVATGWTESSSTQKPPLTMTDGNRMSLYFTYKSHQAVISLTSDKEEAIATLRIQESKRSS